MKYSDIIDLNYEKSTKHPPMSMENRAAQFSPFSALTGLKESLEDTEEQNEIRYSDLED